MYNLTHEAGYSHRYFADIIKFIKLIFRCTNKGMHDSNFPEFVPNGPINYRLPWLRKMARGQNGDKPLFEPITVHFTDAFMGHWVLMS